MTALLDSTLNVSVFQFDCYLFYELKCCLTIYCIFEFLNRLFDPALYIQYVVIINI